MFDFSLSTIQMSNLFYKILGTTKNIYVYLLNSTSFHARYINSIKSAENNKFGGGGGTVLKFTTTKKREKLVLFSFMF